MSQDRAFYYLRLLHKDRRKDDMGAQRFMGALELYTLTYALQASDVRAQLEARPWVEGEKVPLPG